MSPSRGFRLEFSASKAFQREGFLSCNSNELTVNALAFPFPANNDGDKAI